MAKIRVVPVEFRLTGDKELKQFNSSLKTMDASLKKSSKSLAVMEKNSVRTAKAMGTLVGAMIGFAAGRGMQAVIQKTVEQERAVAQLEAAIKSTGNSSGQSAAQLQEFAKEMQKVGIEGDEAVLSVQSMLLTFKQIGSEGDTFNRTTRAVLDLSVAMKQDLKSSAVQLGKALNDPVANLGALSRTGIQFTKDQQKLIKNFAETGRMAEAQSLILEELESQFGGSAEAARKTLGGALKALQNNFGDLFEVTGQPLDDMTSSMNDLADLLADPATVAAAQSFAAAIISIGAGAASASVSMVEFTRWVGESLAAMVGGTELDDFVRRSEQIVKINKELAYWENTGNVGWETSPRVLELKEQLRLLEDQEKVARQLGLDKPKSSSSKAPSTASSTPVAASSGVGNIVPDGLDQRIHDLDQQMLEYEHSLQLAAEEEKRLLEIQKQRSAILSQMYPEMTAHNAAVEQAAEAYQNKAITLDEYNQRLKQIAEESDYLAQGIGEFEQVFVDGFTKNLDTMLDGVLQGTQSVKDGFKDMVKVMIAELLKLAAYKSIMSMFGDTSFGASFGEATGATKWAKGGIITGPTMAAGNNLMGEAGPEGLLPLARMPGGDLGVKSGGVNVTVNNNASGASVTATPDGNGGLTIDVIERALVGKIAQGGNDLSNAMQNTFGLSRAGAY